MAKTKTTKKKTSTKKTPAKKAATKKDTEVKVDRRASAERRGDDRRQEIVDVADERRAKPDRRKVSRRRQIDPTTCERDYNGEEIEFMQALDAYKRAAGRMFPTCSEILEVLRDLGYRRLTPEEIARLAAAAPPLAHDEDTDDPAFAERDKNDEPLTEETLDQIEG